MNKAEKLRQALLTLEEEGVLPKGEASKAVHSITHGREYYLIITGQKPPTPQITAALALQAHKLDYDE